MALDFSNKDPKDPNGILSLDTAGAQDAWVKDKDWSQIYYSQGEASRAGANNKIRIATAVTNDGRKYNVALDANNQPMSEIGDTTGLDDKQHAVWQQTAPKPIAPGASPTQRRQAPDGQLHIYGYNPQTGYYDDDQGAVASGTKPPIPVGGKSETQGTPDPSKPGGWDNTRPRQVITDAKGNVVWSEELTGPDLTAWRNNQQAQMQQAAAQQGATDRKPVPQHPGYSLVTTTVPATATAPARTESHYEKDDAPGVTVPTPADIKAGQVIKGGGANGEDVQAVEDPTTHTISYQPITGAAPPKRPGQVVTLGGEPYWATPASDPGQAPTLTHMDPGTRLSRDGPQMTPGQSPSDYLNARRAWLMQQRQAGVSLQEVKEDWDSAIQTAQQKQNEANTAATQQNQRLSTSMTGFNDALKTASDLASYAPVGSDLAGKGLEAFLTLQRGQAQRSGGYGPLTVPSAPTGPSPSSQVSAIPQPPQTQTQGAMATNEANRQLGAAQNAAPASAPPGGPPPPLGQGQDLSTPPAGGINPPAGDPGNDPTRPVGMVPQGGATVSAIPESPYDFQARIASTPPWKMDEDTYRQAVAMGLGDHFMSVPGRAA